MTIHAEFDFVSRVLNCVDAGLDSIGSVSCHIIYRYLSARGNIERDKIPDRPSEFVRALEALFGQGASILEKNIVRELKREFNIDSSSEKLAEILDLVNVRNSWPQTMHMRAKRPHRGL